MNQRKKFRPNPALREIAGTRAGYLSLLMLCSAATLTPSHAIAQVRGSEELPPPHGHGFVSTVWTIADGLPQGTINDILEADDGILWIATFGGLVRFDGYGFDVLDVARLPGLESNRILEVVAAPSGGVWVITTADEIVRVEADTIAERIANPVTPRGTAKYLRLDDDGTIWVSSDNAVYHHEDGDWRAFRLEEGLAGSLHAVEVDSAGRMYVASGRGLFQLVGNQFVPIDTSPWLRQFPIGKMFSDNRGRLWIGTSAGLAVLDREQGVVRPVHPTGSEGRIGTITAMGPGRPDELWIGGTWGLAHLHLEPDSDVAHVLSEHPPLDGRLVAALIRDRQGNVWAGSAGSGLERLSPRRIWHLTKRDGLPARDVQHIAADGDGGVWLSGSCTGLTHVRGTEVSTITLKDVGLASNCIVSLYRDDIGALWIGQPGTLTRWVDSGAVRTWQIEDIFNRKADVTPIVADTAGRIWFGYGRGRLGYVQDTTVQLVEPHEDFPPLSISSMAFSSDGHLWVGQDGTVTHVVLEGSHMDSVTVLDQADGVPPGSIRFVYQDHSGDVWIGSYGGGLARCGPCGEEFNPITTTDGLADNSLSGLLEDEKHRFWILGNRGVSVVGRAVVDSVIDGTRSRVDAVIFDYLDGMPEGNSGRPAAVLDSLGIGWFATIDGLVAVDTRAFPRDTAAPSPRIEALRFGQETWTGTEPIEVDGGATEVGVRYSASSAVSLSKTLYRYRLAGQDEDWVYADRPGIARYPRVPPGRYEFALEARSEDGVWSREPAVIEFQVLPLWWETRWFQWSAGLLALGLVGAIVARRLARCSVTTSHSKQTAAADCTCMGWFGSVNSRG